MIEYDDIPGELTDRITELRESLIGSSFQERFEYLVSAPAWRVHDRREYNEVPPLLEAVGNEIVEGGTLASVVAARMAVQGDEQMVELLFERISSMLQDLDLPRALELIEVVPESALLGSVIGLAKQLGDTWTCGYLVKWLTPQRGRLVVRAAHMLEPTAQLAKLCIRAVEGGFCSTSELGRLLYGAWASKLPESLVADIARILSSTGQLVDLERALGIVSQWLSDHSDDELSILRPVVMQLVEQTTDVDMRYSAMISLYREQVLTRTQLPPASRREIFARLLRQHGRSLDSYDLRVIDEFVRQEPDLAIETVFAVILGSEDEPDAVGLLWLQGSHILSRVLRAAPESVALARLEQVSPNRWRELVYHVNFSVAEPDWLVEALATFEHDEVVKARAALAFMYPESGWHGEESAYLEKRKELAKRWLENEALSASLRQWLRDVIGELDARIKACKLREAEER